MRLIALASLLEQLALPPGYSRACWPLCGPPMALWGAPPRLCCRAHSPLLTTIGFLWPGGLFAAAYVIQRRPGHLSPAATSLALFYGSLPLLPLLPVSVHSTTKNRWGRTSDDTCTCSAGASVGQRAQLVQTPDGNLLWESLSVIDEAAVDLIRARGGLRATPALAPALQVQVQVSPSRTRTTTAA